MKASTAAYIIYCGMIIATVYHVLVMSGVVRLDMAWGGRMKTTEQMLIFESLSVFLNLMFVLLAAIRVKNIVVNISPAIVHILLWLSAGIFMLNTIGNLQAINKWETILFTPVTATLAIMFMILARKEAS